MHGPLVKVGEKRKADYDVDDLKDETVKEYHNDKANIKNPKIVVNVEYLYLVYTREAQKVGENVFKIGQTSLQNFQRFKGYAKETLILLLISCENSKELEKKVKKLFQDKYIHRSDYGNEFFEGSYVCMRNDIIELVKTEESQYKDKKFTCESINSLSRQDSQIISNDAHFQQIKIPIPLEISNVLPRNINIIIRDNVLWYNSRDCLYRLVPSNLTRDLNKTFKVATTDKFQPFGKSYYISHTGLQKLLESSLLKKRVEFNPDKEKYLDWLINVLKEPFQDNNITV